MSIEDFANTHTGRGALALLGLVLLLAGVLVAPSAHASRIAAGRTHTCTVADDGTVACWGASYVNGSPDQSTTPVEIDQSLLAHVTDVVAGWSHTCALKNDGSVACWGHGSAGQLGGSSNLSWKPVPIAGLSNIAALAAGDRHVCARSTNQTVYCWGDNFSGQLGNGLSGGGVATPGLVVNGAGTGQLSGVIAITAGGDHSCALKSDHTVVCWGGNFNGQLGDGTTGPSTTPVTVKNPGGGGPLSGVIDVAAGEVHTCALKTDGSVLCWGANWTGQLGAGNFGNASLLPVVVRNSTDTGPLSGVTAITAAGVFTCALKSDQAVVCWGSNDSGQLGGDSLDISVLPVAVEGLTDAVAISAGYKHACALKANGLMVCWGSNSNGQLGNGLEPNQPRPSPVAGLSQAVSVTAGNSHACAIAADGSVRCWGGNDDGQLGNGTRSTASRLPVKVHSLAGASVVTVGFNHTCALGYGTWEVPLCWGSNGWGQLGTGAFGSGSTTPVFVSGLPTAMDVAAGRRFACALKPDASVACWGDNGSGQLGNGQAGGELAVPTPVNAVSGSGDLTDIQAITVGWQHACALKTDGTVVCWGGNFRGQLGDGTLSPHAKPVFVRNLSGTGHLTNVVAIAAGPRRSCALKANGKVFCWGWGPLGDGTRNDSALPVQVVGLADVTALAVGLFHSCALKNDGTVMCWGRNGWGAVGDGSRYVRDQAVPVAGLSNAVAIAAGFQFTCAAKAAGTVECWGSARYGRLGNGRHVFFPTPQPVQNFGDQIFTDTFGWQL